LHPAAARFGRHLQERPAAVPGGRFRRGRGGRYRGHRRPAPAERPHVAGDLPHVARIAMVAGSRPNRARSGRQAIAWIAPAGAVILSVVGYSPVLRRQQACTCRGDWVGLETFELVLGDPLFTTGLSPNVLLLLVVPVITAGALLLAVCLFETRRGLK